MATGIGTGEITLTAQAAESMWRQPLKLEGKSFALSIGKALTHIGVGKFEVLGDDLANALNSLGLKSDSLEARVFQLLSAALGSALNNLFQEYDKYYFRNADLGALAASFREHLENEFNSIEITQDFFQQPKTWAGVTKMVGALEQALNQSGFSTATAQTIAQRFPGYFPIALHQEWSKKPDFYAEITKGLNTPFAAAVNRDWEWKKYAAYLDQELDKSIFDEPFGLHQIYIPLNAYYVKENKQGEKTVVFVCLAEELAAWLTKSDKNDAIRMISGGPGSGKSSFAKKFAEEIANEEKFRVLLVPLHLIDASKDFSGEISNFLRDTNSLSFNPLDNGNQENNLVIILDGLDELASQGKAAVQLAKDFVRTVRTFVERKNHVRLCIRVIFCGREIAIQDSEKELKSSEHIYTVLPYLTSYQKISSELNILHSEGKNLLSEDKRNVWWSTYGKLTGENYQALPEELRRDDLEEITSQPLLNYLLALSFCRGKLNFANTVTLNQIYNDLVEAVHERAYENKRKHAGASGLTTEDFILILEEIGLATWHGDGRSTTVARIETYCKSSGLDRPLQDFCDGAEQGLTRLLAAFFFRQQGSTYQGDKTFVFTHKSFGEYLTARRLVRGMLEIAEEMERYASLNRRGNKGWSINDALVEWIRLCGAAPMTEFILSFLRREIALLDKTEVENLQNYFTQLFNSVLEQPAPMEKAGLSSFAEMFKQSCHAEQSLLLALNVCACVTKSLISLTTTSPDAFHIWLNRITNLKNDLVRSGLSWLNLKEVNLYKADLQGVNLEGANLEGAKLDRAILIAPNLRGTNLRGANLQGATFFGGIYEGANFQKILFPNACLSGASLQKANLQEAFFAYANLRKTNLQEAELYKAGFDNANLEQANLKGAILKEADFTYANLQEANLQEAELYKANFYRAKLEKANLKGAILQEAFLAYADLRGANLHEANLEGANLEGANLEGAILTNVIGLPPDLAYLAKPKD